MSWLWVQSSARRRQRSTREHQLEDPGTAKRLTIEKDNPTITEGAATKKAIEGRVKQIRTQIEETTSDDHREPL